jgi:Tfp pilus assembly protein PilZ
MVELESQTKINLQEIIKKRERIKFRISRGVIWYVTTVEQIIGDEVTLAFPEMVAAAEVLLSDSLECRFDEREDFEYRFSGDIASIKVDFPQRLVIKIIGDINKVRSTRKSKRISIPTLLLASITREDEELGMPSFIQNVSESGLGLVSKYHFKLGSSVFIRISLPLRNIFDSKVDLRGKIMWATPSHHHKEYGVMINDIDDMFFKRLMSFAEKYN